jgi:hypothetical protein
LYGSETWSLTLKDQHTVRAFKNRVLRIIIEPKRKKLTWGWRNMHNEELYKFYASSNIISDKIKEVKMDTACST